jgi:hypothetical protein
MTLALSFSDFARADCMAKIHSQFGRPVYEVVACGPAEPIVEMLRESQGDRLGKFTYAEQDVVITVKAANNAARERMWQDQEYWYYAAGCSAIREGMQFTRPTLEELCCDVLPINTLPCGVGGTRLLSLKGAR